jgi:hypothetical protein
MRDEIRAKNKRVVRCKMVYTRKYKSVVYDDGHAPFARGVSLTGGGAHCGEPLNSKLSTHKNYSMCCHRPGVL